MNFQRLARATYFSLALSSFAAAQKISQDPSQPAIPSQPGVLRDTLTAKQLTTSEKFGVRIVQQFGIRGLVGSAISSSFTQAANTPEEWGRSWEGYGKRYASDFGETAARQVFAFGLETALHEDPRYFPSSEKAFVPRFKNVLKQVLITKKDDGKATFAYARVLSAFGSSQLSNTWQPKSNNSVGDGLERGAYTLLGDGAFFFLQEFFPFSRNTHFGRHH